MQQIPTNIRTPIRMCVCCRGRFAQDSLYRLQYCANGKRLVAYSGLGRSFYLCSPCAASERVWAALVRVCKVDKKQKHMLSESLKEIICQYQNLESMKLPKS